MSKNRDKSAYKIGWICALPLEFAAAVEILDKRHPQLPRDESDYNTYEFGQVGDHCNIIIASLPSGVYGTNSAASVATNFRRSFPDITACLMVGIGGGAPVLPQNDIRLGDVVVGHPVPGYGGVLQYDFGKTIQEGNFIHTGVLNKPPAIFLQAITKLKADYFPNPGALDKAIEKLIENPSVAKAFGRPDTQSDRLFEAHYDHPVENESCQQCDPEKAIVRPPRSEYQSSTIHYGLIASGNQVMKHGQTRDQLSRSKGVLCFEMEAAGIVDEIPTLVIRGICDYCDSHKNKKWQPYSALVAAVFAKELLLRLPIQAPNKTNNKLDAESYECLRDLGATNPKDDKTRYELTKDEPIVASYSWIFSDQFFANWVSDGGKPMLWVSGDPGKGKTMLTIGVINFLEGRLKESHQNPTTSITYFFCQATDNRRNSAAAVLKGLLYHLTLNDSRGVIIGYLKEEFDKAGPGCFSGPNAFYVLQRVFRSIFNDHIFEELYLVIDGLDECTEGLDELIHFASQSLSWPGSSRAKWFLTSRNRPDIEERLDGKGFKHRISLEGHHLQVDAAVNTYIKEKVAHLDRIKHYTQETREQIEDILRERAGSTFLWAHLACKELVRVKASQAITALRNLPSMLRDFYQEMLDNVQTKNSEEDAKICHQLLSAVTLAVRPLSLLEMAIVAGLPREMDESELEIQVRQCGSFLIIQDKTILFVHQTAKDFLDDHIAGFVTSESGDAHHMIAKGCLQRLSEELKLDICNLEKPDFGTKELDTNQREQIAHLGYACYYWIHHLTKSRVGDRDEMVLGFLREHLLHWLEALILLGASLRIVPLIIELEGCVWKDDETREFFYDIRRFVRYHLATVAETPLQLYHSALVFTPEESIVKKLFLKSRPDWICRVQGLDKHWGPLVQTLRTSHHVKAIALSKDVKYLASTPAQKYENGITIWDVASGMVLGDLVGHSRPVLAFNFSASGENLVSKSSDGVAMVWNVLAGTILHTFREGGLPDSPSSLPSPYAYLQTEITSFLRNDSLVACGSSDGCIRIWDAGDGKLIRGLHKSDSRILCLKASQDGNQLAAASADEIIRLWHVPSGALLQELETKGFLVFSVDFSPDGKRLVSAFSAVRLVNEHLKIARLGMPTICLWELAGGTVLKKHRIFTLFRPGMSIIPRVIFSTDGSQVFFGDCARDGWYCGFFVWDLVSKQKPKLLFYPETNERMPFVLSADGTLFTTTEGQMRQFDVSWSKRPHHDSGASKPTPTIKTLALSPNGKTLAYTQADPPWSRRRTISLVDADSGKALWVSNCTDHSSSFYPKALEFSPDGKLLMARCSGGTSFGTVKFWDAASGVLFNSLTGNDDKICYLAFSSTSKMAASFLLKPHNTIGIWDTDAVHISAIFAQTKAHNTGLSMVSNLFAGRGKVPRPPAARELIGHKDKITCMRFSLDGIQLVSTSSDHTIKIWDVATGDLLQTFPLPYLGGVPVKRACIADGRLVLKGSREIILMDLLSGKKGPSMDTQYLFFGEIYPIYNGSFVKTDEVVLKLPTLEDSKQELKTAVHVEEWFKYNQADLLYIPRDYKPDFFDISSISGETVVFGTNEGVLVVLRMPVALS